MEKEIYQQILDDKIYNIKSSIYKNLGDLDAVRNIINDNCLDLYLNDIISDYSIIEKEESTNITDYTTVDVYLIPKVPLDKVSLTVNIKEDPKLKRKRLIKEKQEIRKNKLDRLCGS